VKLFALLALLSILGCRGRDEPRGAAPAPTKSAPQGIRPTKVVGLESTLDKTPLPLENAFAFSRGGSALHLMFSTHPLACENLGGAGFELQPGELAFDVTVAPSLRPDGKERWSITGSRLGGMTRQGDLGQVDVEAADPHKTVKVKFKDAALAFPPNEIGLDGSVSATPCAILPWSDKARVRPQRELAVELAGKRIAIHGASLTPEVGGVRTLTITSEPHACGHGVMGSDYGVRIELATGADGLVAQRVLVSGYSLTRELAAKEVAHSVAVKLGDEAAEIEATVTADLEVGGYHLAIDGRVRAEPCAR
jgi:hypothetical protein